MDHRQNERSAVTVPGIIVDRGFGTDKRQYQKPVLNRVGLLRDLTQFSF